MTKKKTAPSDLATQFFELFPANQRSVGQYDPHTSRMWQPSRTPTLDDVAAHFDGSKVGMGLVPILDDDSCFWGAIDIDQHGEDEDLPIVPVDNIIRTNKLPLLACRSKSGGIHCYVFFTKAQPAIKVQGMLTRWAEVLGFPKAEVFPKQGKLPPNRQGKRQLGNWINLPYFGGDATNRYCFRGGKKLTLAEFLAAAVKNKLAPEEVNSQVLIDHPQAPPCVQRMLTEGVDQGQRNEALYNITIYLRKRNSDTFEGDAHNINATIFAKPLPRPEAVRTITSAGRPDYKYRCNEEPCHSFCDRDACIKRKHGISREDADLLATQTQLPAFTNLTKFVSDPVRWEVQIDGSRVANLSTGQLLDWRVMQEMIAERLMKVVPLIKNVEWHRILQPLMKEARVVETPDDASISGVIRERLREFAAKTDLTNKGQDNDDRRALLRGLPCVQMMDGTRQVVFRGQDFVNYLKRTKSEELKGVNLWFAVRDVGVQHSKIRVAGKANINVWFLPVKEVETDAPEAPEFKSKL